MTDFISTISIWAAPPLFAAVIWLVIQKSSDTDSSIKTLDGKLDAHMNEVSAKIDRIENTVNSAISDIRTDNNKASQFLVNIQASINAELMEINKVTLENKVQAGIISRWIDEYKTDHGRIIFLEGKVTKHEKALKAARELFQSQSLEIFELKKTGTKK